MKSLIVVLAMGLFAVGCASVKGSGKYARSVGPKVTKLNFNEDIKATKELAKTPSKVFVSGAENVSLSSKYFTMIDLTFENDSPKWKRVKSVSLNFGSKEANKNVRFPVGKDLLEWAESARRVRAIKDYNMNMAFGTVAAAGAVASTSNSKQTRGAGQAALVGSGMVLSANSIGRTLSKIQNAGAVPKDHLLAGQFSIPPGLHTKKWITFYTEEPMNTPYIDKVALTLKYDDGTQEAVLLRFREVLDTRGSKWQKKHPEVLQAVKKRRRSTI